MLFDLRGAGRRKTVQVTYIFLAFLMGGGLVLFGIGGSGLGGGLLDALSGSNGSSTGNGAYQKRVDQMVQETRAHPKSAGAWADLARARFQLASVPDDFDANTGTWNAAGKRVLAQAADAWQHHLKLAGNKPDDGVAGLMVQAYGSTGLNQPANAVSAQEIITEARPTSATFARLAVLAYDAGQTRKGDLASQKALSLSDKDLRANLKSQLDAAKQQAAQSGASATATPSATASGSGSGSSKGSKSGSKKGSGKGSSGK
jgi:hypothetical protein